MGCDIHATVEKKVGDRWVMVNRLDFRSRPEAMQRNYKRFAALAGVRGDGPDPRGLPPDISESTKLYADEWKADGHSHSFLELNEAAKIFLDNEWPAKGISDYAKKYPSEHYFSIHEAKPGEYRLVFWFDN